ncbi:hypothetical protein [Parvicella tangerina]|nr:hypothetical protein [Parvicella tangerina]
MKNEVKKALRLSTFILPLFLLLLSSCNTEEGKEFASFFVGFVIFLVGTVVVGIPGIVFSAISISSKHKSMPILAIVFTVLYLVFFVIMMSVFGQGKATKLDGSIIVFPIINMAIIIMNAVFIYMGFKNRANQPISSADDQADLLDDLINEDEESII